jgi:hypothetical protein
MFKEKFENLNLNEKDINSIYLSIYSFI